VSIITAIDFDHEEWLGNTLTEIAGEKAGIIKPGVPLFSAPQQADAGKVIRARAAECAAPLQFVTEFYHQSPIALRGEPSKQNAALAIAALRARKSTSTTQRLCVGLRLSIGPLVFQKWDERTIVDGAHNPAAARVVVETWQRNFWRSKGNAYSCGSLRQNLRGICEALAPIGDSFLLPKIRSERAAQPER